MFVFLNIRIHYRNTDLHFVLKKETPLLLKTHWYIPAHPQQVRGTEQFDAPIPVSDFVYITSERRYFIPSKNWRLSFSAFFTDLSYICDFMPVYSLGKGLGLGPTGPSVLPAAISTERSKISSQFMQNKFQSWLCSWSVDVTMVSQECHTLQNVWEGMILSDTDYNRDTQSLFAVCHLNLQSNKAEKWNYELPWGGKDGQ